mmetsp:Transcript_52707/g.142071  ORF Transcript_52707/g.142071 Transcript_52707/m.142071 type:complete len:218 (-) Transcript_52707:618-1271(-)
MFSKKACALSPRRSATVEWKSTMTYMPAAMQASTTASTSAVSMSSCAWCSPISTLMEARMSVTRQSVTSQCTASAPQPGAPRRCERSSDTPRRRTGLPRSPRMVPFCTESRPCRPTGLSSGNRWFAAAAVRQSPMPAASPGCAEMASPPAECWRSAVGAWVSSAPAGSSEAAGLPIGDTENSPKATEGAQATALSDLQGPLPSGPSPSSQSMSLLAQ